MMTPGIDHRNWKVVENLKRRQMKISTHIRTGHSILNYHMANMRKLDSSLCPCDEGEDETVFHFVARCPQWASIRHQIFGKIEMTEGQMKDLKIHKILTFTEKTGRYADFMI